MKEESEKVGLQLNIQKTKIMAFGPITSWQIDGETVETVTDFILEGSKITADGEWNHELKRCLLLGRKVMTNLDSILKSRDITLPTKVHLVKAMVFLVVMYGCESWTIKKAEHRRIDAFELWCWRRLLRVPSTARRANQSILKEISPEYSLEGLMLKLKLQYFGHLMWRTDSFEKTLILGKIEGRRRRGWQDEMVGWHHQLSGHGFGWTLGVGDGQRGLVCHSPWGCKKSDMTKWLNWLTEGHTWELYLTLLFKLFHLIFTTLQIEYSWSSVIHWFCIHGYNQQQMENIWKKFQKFSKSRICVVTIVLGLIRNLII